MEKIREDIGEVVKDIKFSTNKTKFGTRYFVKLTLKDDTTSEILCKENDMFLAIQSTAKYVDKPIISKELVEEISEKDDISSKYLCIKVIVAGNEDRPFRVFLSTGLTIAVNNYYNFVLNKK